MYTKVYTTFQALTKYTIGKTPGLRATHDVLDLSWKVSFDYENPIRKEKWIFPLVSKMKIGAQASC